jgi:hypothetical protein
MASTALFIAGAALAAGGVVLYLTAPNAEDKKVEQPKVGAYVGTGTLGVLGRW